MSKIFKVILPLKLNMEFHYLGNNEKLGDLVSVPFGRQKQVGVVWEEIKQSDCPGYKLKAIEKILISELYNKAFREFIKYFADYNVVSLGQVIKLILPTQEIMLFEEMEFVYSCTAQEKGQDSKKRKALRSHIEEGIKAESQLKDLGYSKAYLTSQLKSGFLFRSEQKRQDTDSQQISYKAAAFTAAQSKALTELRAIQQRTNFSVSFLNGVTGSGKTEIYFDILAEKLSNPNNQALILLPEILLTKQFIDKFEKRFSLKLHIWHSSTSAKDKKRIWRGLIDNKIRIVVGARSALFLPFKNLSTIILDEEHDGSYKQEDNLPYHGRDMAVVRAYKEGVPIILASATPSFETRHNCDIGKYEEVVLGERYKGNLPAINIIDLKSEGLPAGKWLSEELKKQIAQRLAQKEQVMLFLNRKGYAPLKICSGCGYRFKCESCDVWLVEHKKNKQLVCHHCDYRISSEIECPSCKESDKFISYGPGVERIAEEAQELFPEARIALITSDESKNLQNIKEVIAQIEAGEVDIIVGTQIISKGHHFGRLNLVGVIDGDIGDIADMRSSEKMFQLLQQIAGRAGRESGDGQVYIQAFNPQTSFLQALINGDRDGFYKAELCNRKKYNLPPYNKLIALIISADNRDYAAKIAQDMAQYLRPSKDITILGPAAAPIHFLRNKYRFRILIKIAKEKSASDIFKPILNDIFNLKKASVKIEVDPVSFM